MALVLPVASRTISSSGFSDLAQRLGKVQQAAAFEIDLAGIPDNSLLQDCHLGEGSMNIESDDPHLQLLFGCTTSGASGPHDTYGSALAAHPGQSKGRPDNNASSQLIR
jgi:hypothetical protein